MIPLRIKTRRFTEPDDPLYYLAASNGVFLVRKTPLFVAATRTDAAPGLATHSEELSLRFPKVPRDVMEALFGFFREVYRRWESEAVAFLYFTPETGRFRIGVPPQTVRRYRSAGGWRTEGRVEYYGCTRPEGFLKLGDAHSHGDIRAFFSSVDDDDDKEDGLRVILGRVDRPQPDIRVSFVAGGVRFRLEPDEVLEDFFRPISPPRGWMRQVICRYEDWSGAERGCSNGRGWGSVG